ncbi:hypothetical protein CIHG_00615 [Coccidioides immitis H538.4]|uniref:Uncharacterized protein n=3 Tax=Coccidioides immitis TaxID=5501 RepID=A0A0J8QH92_COCIT|nr:hypothetical protein CIRG_07425 [Coccidioides immitis RMSCC 2394]KMU71800.1 hypothetical protein CISG_00111 [Coccidioides immitis RMSCC 3703]KMU82833.1 hypothetical protein CIHG_00615 [Coccidioides immitis H538.4]
MGGLSGKVRKNVKSSQNIFHSESNCESAGVVLWTARALLISWSSVRGACGARYSVLAFMPRHWPTGLGTKGLETFFGQRSSGDSLAIAKECAVTEPRLSDVMIGNMESYKL